MGRSIRSHFAASVVGGLVVAGSFLVLGITGKRSVQTIVEEAPAAGTPLSGHAKELTPHAIYVRDAPAVVYVKALVTEQVENPFDLYPEPVQSSSTGSGFLIRRRDAAGYIITNYHVIEGADPRTGITVEFEDDRARPAVLVDEDESDDLALLKVSLAGLPSVTPLRLGNSSTVRVGDPTLAIGNPFGLDRTLTNGIVSALQRQIQAPNGFAINNVIQTDAPLNPGNSGGPLLDAAGNVIGINSQLAANVNGGGSVGIAFAVPINTAEQFLPLAERGARATYAYLGVSPSGIGGQRGVVVDVQPGGPAANAGLRNHDTIETIDGEKVTAIDQVDAIVASRMPGVALSVIVKRGKRTLHRHVVLGERLAVVSR
jgi:S1-C subfamily serine protease